MEPRNQTAKRVIGLLVALFTIAILITPYFAHAALPGDHNIGIESSAANTHTNSSRDQIGSQRLSPGSKSELADYYGAVNLPTLPLEVWAAIIVVIAILASTAVVLKRAFAR